MVESILFNASPCRIARNLKVYSLETVIQSNFRKEFHSMNQALVGVIGGSGLYRMDALRGAQEQLMQTPFGAPSDALVTGRVYGVPVAFLARHGRGHRLLPFELPASDAHSALQYALVTQPGAMAPEVRARLAALLD